MNPTWLSIRRLQPCQRIARCTLHRVRAADTLLAQLRLQAVQALEKSLTQAELLVSDSVLVEQEKNTYTASVGQVADAVGLDMQVKARAIAVDRTRVAEVVQHDLKRRMPAGFRFQPESVTYQIEYLAAAGDGLAQVEVNGSGMGRAGIDPDALINRVRGQPVGEAVAQLGTDSRLARPPEIHLVPDWLGRVPWLTARIRVVTKEAQ